MKLQATEHLSVEETVIDVRRMPRTMRHPLIFSTFDRLRREEFFSVVSDHDPRPLHYLFEVKYPGAFTWDYVVEGPDVWCVRIGRHAQADTRLRLCVPKTQIRREW
jgi:uncharacterized protein (DUF2249 family)